MSQLFDCREAFAAALAECAATDPRIVAVVNDSAGSSGLDGFQARFPQRLINVGIAEQTMVGVAAGLAACDKIPFVSGAACFLTGRATEQLKVDVAYSGRNVKLCGQAPGLSYGELGPTHHSVEDLSWLRAMPHLPVIVPSDPIETAAVIRWMASFDGPAYARISRTKVPCLFDESYEFTLGKGTILRDGSDVTVITNGVLLAQALIAADQLSATGIDAQIVSMPTVAPLDDALVLACAAKTGRLVTVEEALVSGGLGASVASLVVANHPVPMRLLGLPDRLAPTGSQSFLLDHFGLSAAGIEDAARSLVNG